VLFLPQVLEKVKPRDPHPIWGVVPTLTVREPLKAVLITPTFEQLSVMNAFALPPLPSLLSVHLPPVPVLLGVTTTAVFEQPLTPPVVVQAGTGGGAQVAGHEAMQRPMAPGSSKDRQLFSQVLMQSAEARLAMVMAASPAIDATNRFIFSISSRAESMGSIDASA
jgi:hypothetical protein